MRAMSSSEAWLATWQKHEHERVGERQSNVDAMLPSSGLSADNAGVIRHPKVNMLSEDCPRWRTGMSQVRKLKRERRRQRR